MQLTIAAIDPSTLTTLTTRQNLRQNFMELSFFIVPSLNIRSADF
jgi:hypothetical protein